MSPASERPRPAVPGTNGAASVPTPDAHPQRKKRMSKRSLKVVTAGVAAAGFAMPWVVMHAVPKTATGGLQTVIVPSGAQVTLVKSSTGGGTGVVVVTSKSNAVSTGPTVSTPAGPPVATTHASKPPPPGA